MATVIYNGVTITNCETKRFEVTNQMDSSDTDIMFRRFTIEVVGYCSTILGSSTANVSTNASDVTIAFRNTRQMLLENRKSFQYLMNGQVVLSASPGSTSLSNSTDVNNGPTPRYCTLARVSPAVFKILFGIEVCLIDCLDNNNSKGVLSNRWATSEDIDESHYLTRTTTGRLRVGNLNLDPLAFRGWGIPSLPPGMRRMAIRVNRSPDGLTLDYSITDKQQFAAPPFPAVDWGCTHGLTTGDGVTCFGEVSIWLQGAPSTPKADLIATAASVCMRKLDIFGQNLANPKDGKQQGFWINQAAIIDTVDQNRIEMSLRVQYSGATRLQVMASPNSPTLGKSLDQMSQALPGYSPTQFPAPSIFGDGTTASAFVCFLQTPCDDNHKYPQAQPQSPRQDALPANSQDTITETTEGTLLDNPQSGSNYTPSHLQMPYTYYQVSSKYVLDDNKVQLPSGSGSADATSKVVQLFRPTAKRIVKVYAERSASWPNIPKPADVNTDKFLGWTVDLKAPQLGADAETLLFGVEAEYRYAITKPPQAGELRSGHVPWLSDNLVEPVFFMPADSLQEGIA